MDTARDPWSSHFGLAVEDLPGPSPTGMSEVDELQLALAREQARADDLKGSLRTARRIGMAVGLLMARHELTESEAFQALESETHRSGRKLHETAEAILLAGGLRHAATQVSG